MIKFPFFKTTTTLILILITHELNAQFLDGHGYMMGDYVEFTINKNGYEGAPCNLLTSNCRTVNDYFGIVADPEETDWEEFNGDYSGDGERENGFGLTFTVLGNEYSYGNNASGINNIAGGITYFEESMNIITVIWEGTIDDIALTLKYIFKKDEHYYLTSVLLENTGSQIYSNLYFYKTINPDNNASIGSGYITENIIFSQASLDEDSCMVQASQNYPWPSDIILSAKGENWRCFIGGEENRNGAEMWNGIGFYDEVGDTISYDESIGLAYKIETLSTESPSSYWFTYATSFKSGISFATLDLNEFEEIGINFNLYPNPTNDVVTINLTDNYTYSITDLKGSIVLNGIGNGINEIDLSGVEKGIYFITIQQENQTATTKLIVN